MAFAARSVRTGSRRAPRYRRAHRPACSGDMRPGEPISCEPHATSGTSCSPSDRDERSAPHEPEARLDLHLRGSHEIERGPANELREIGALEQLHPDVRGAVVEHATDMFVVQLRRRARFAKRERGSTAFRRRETSAPRSCLLELSRRDDVEHGNHARHRNDCPTCQSTRRAIPNDPSASNERPSSSHSVWDS